MKQDLPSDFISIVRGFGDEYADPLLEALGTTPSVSVRANTLKRVCPPSCADIVPWLPQGFYLAERPVFAADPAWHQGLYYVQDASSMVYTEVVSRIVGRFFQDMSDLRYLDACASPGGKTIAAIEALPADAFVVSNEFDRHRANILLENINKAGAPNVAVCRGDAAKFRKCKDAFDIIAVDAPCSGEGMMRKEPEAIRQWSSDLIRNCVDMQRNILSAVWNALRPGGVIIFSTCTFNSRENEENVAFIAAELGGESIDLGLDTFPGVWKGFSTDIHCYRFAPGHVRGEGLFIAALRKPGGYSANPSREAKLKGKPLSGFVASHIIEPEKYLEISTNTGVELRPKTHAAFIADIASATDMLRGGIPVATLKGRDLIPTHELAMSTVLDSSSFPTLEADYHGAMSYLRGESISELPDGLPKGFVLVTYAGRPLGFIKNIGRRANNLYPDVMRLRLDPRSLPAQAPTPIVNLQ